MQREQRLTGQESFSNIRKYGRGVANQLLVLRTHPNGLGTSRYAFLTGKRIGNAVIRNRMKRHLREAVRSSNVKSGWDAIFIARRGSSSANFHQLKDAVSNLLTRAELLENTPGHPLIPDRKSAYTEKHSPSVRSGAV